MTRRVLVTGANGFVGAAIVRAARARGWQVAGLVRRQAAGMRACDYSLAALEAAIHETQPDLLVHAAGAASVPASFEDPGADFASSVALTQRLLEAARRTGVRPLLAYVSSAAVYGRPDRLPIPETASLRPISPYGVHKMMCERLIEEYASWYGLPGLCLRVFSLIGEGQRRLLAWDIFRQAMAGPVALSGTGEESRDYLHVDDFAPLLLAAAQRHPGGFEVLNAASGRAVTVREVAQEVLRVAGRGGPVSFDGRQRPGDPKEWRADVAHLEERVGALQLPSFESRLAAVVRSWGA